MILRPKISGEKPSVTGGIQTSTRNKIGSVIGSVFDALEVGGSLGLYTAGLGVNTGVRLGKAAYEGLLRKPLS